MTAPFLRSPSGVAIASMSPALFIAASLSPDTRQDIGIQVLTRSHPISHIAATHQVSRKFVYRQGDKAQQALDESFAPSKGDDDVGQTHLKSAAQSSTAIGL